MTAGRRFLTVVLFAAALSGGVALSAAADGSPSPDPPPQATTTTHTTTNTKQTTAPTTTVAHTTTTAPNPPRVVQQPVITPQVTKPVTKPTPVVHKTAAKKASKAKVTKKTHGSPPNRKPRPAPAKLHVVTTPDIVPVSVTPNKSSTPIFLWVGAALAALALTAGVVFLVPNPVRGLRARKATRRGLKGPDATSYARSYMKWISGKQ